MNPFDPPIEAVPWSRLRTAGGNAADVPSALRDLTSPEEPVRKRGYWRIDNHVVLQSDLYEAAYHVAPFLIAMLGRKTIGRDLVYDLLIEIASGYAPADVVVTTADGQRRPLTDACILAVKTGRAEFQADLRHADPRIRRKAAELLDALGFTS